MPRRQIPTIFKFSAPPAAGSVEFEHGGQLYVLVAAEPYIRKTDGGSSVLMTWSTNCKTCGIEMTTTTGATPQRDNPRRRCVDCRKDSKLTR